MKIIICDDDSNFINILRSKISAFLEESRIQYDIQQYSSEEELLQCYNITQVDIIFLDIKLARMNGIEVAAALRKINPNFVLVFISGIIEYAPAGYEVNALRYILKEQLNELFPSTMEAILKEMGYFRTKVSFKFVNGTASIYTDEIIYLESNLHRTYFYLDEKKVYYLYETLDIIEKKLPENEFIRIHKSYLVNLKFILDARKNRVILTGGLELPISQKNFSNVKKKIFLYKGKM